MAVEPWLRGTLTEVGAVQRAVLHALEMAGEDLELWCGSLSDEELNARPYEIAPVAFHLRHIPRSLDRLLTYAEGEQLSAEQLAVMKTELDGGATKAALLEELKGGAGVGEAAGAQVYARDLWRRRAGWGGRRCRPAWAGCWCIARTIRCGMWGRPVTTAKVVAGMRA